MVAPDVGMSLGTAGLLVTTVQLGYAVGLFLVVPVADDGAIKRRSTWQLAALSVAFLVAALQRELVGLVVTFLVIGLVVTVGQCLITVAHAQAPPGKSTQSVAVVMTAMLVGMFGGRILAGFLAEAAGWRWVLVLLGAAAALSILPVRLALTGATGAPGAGTRYLTTLRATVALFLHNARLREIAFMQFFVFAAFTAMWTVIAVHLTSPHIGWTIAQANQFGAVGLLAGLVAPILLMDNGPRRRLGRDTLTVALPVMICGPLLAAVQPDSILLVAASMFLLTMGNQVIHAVQQDRAMSLVPDDRAKSNAVLMVIVFVGGATGAAIGPAAYAVGGMPLAGAITAGSVVIATLWWLLRLRPTTPG